MSVSGNMNEERKKGGECEISSGGLEEGEEEGRGLVGLWVDLLRGEVVL